MPELFLRQAQVTIGSSGNPKALEIDSLRIGFKIDKTVLPDPNKATIQIYNLKEKSRQKFEDKNSRILLKVGYGKDSKDLKQIFIGDVRRVAHVKQGPDWITEIEAGDGEVDFTGSVNEKQFEAGTPLKQVFTDVVGELKDVKNNIANGLKFAGNLAQGLVTSGSVAKVLDNLTARVGAEWSVQDNELQVLKIGEPKITKAIFLSPETGLVGSPAKTFIGFQITCLLNPDLKPGGLAQILSRDAKGLFRIQSVQHGGDSFSGQWLSVCELEVPK